MGSGLILAGLPYTAKVSNNAALVYVAMALHARDRDGRNVQGRLYYGGHVRIAATLGRMPSESVLRHIRAAIGELTEAGLISLVSRAATGRTAVYQIHTEPGPPVDNSPPGSPPEARL